MSAPSGAANVPVWPWGDAGAAEAASLVRPHLPQALGEALQPIGAGDFCFAFRTNGWVVRVARHAEAAAAIRREACVLERVADRLPLAVPRVRRLAPDGCPPFTIHREVVGAVLTRSAWSGLPSAARAGVAEQLAELMKSLHRLAGECRDCELSELDESAFAESLGQASRGELKALLTPRVATRLDAFLAARAGGHRMPRPTALLHADIAPGHLLYDETSNELTGLIDFGDVVLGPPARDFVYIYEDFGVERCQEVVAAYAGSDAAALMEDVRAWYLLETLSWTVGRLAAGAQADAAGGLAELTRELPA